MIKPKNQYLLYQNNGLKIFKCTFLTLQMQYIAIIPIAAGKSLIILLL